MLNNKYKRILRRSLANLGAPDHLAKRAHLATQIKHRTRDGRIAVVFSGMDCNGVVYSGKVTVLPAITVGVMRCIQRAVDDAEGPINYRIENPVSARGLRFSTVDLGAQAHEDGHPYVISYKGGPSL